MNQVVDLTKAEYTEWDQNEPLSGVGVPIRYRPHPIYTNMIFGVCEPGQTIMEALHGIPDLEDRFYKVGIVRLNGTEIDRKYWHVTRLKPYIDANPVVLTLHLDPAGGISKTVKNVVTIVAAVALVVATGFIAAGGLATLFPALFSATAFGAGTLGAALAAAAVGAVGSLALSALTPSPIAPKTDALGGQADTKAEAFARGNLLDPGGSVPRIIGTYKVFPVLACQALTEVFDDGDTVVEALFMLAGPHNMSDLRIDGIATTELTDFDFEVRQGFGDDPPITLVDRYGFTTQLNAEMTRHRLASTAGTDIMRNPDTADQDIPQWRSLYTRTDPDEFWIQLALAEGLYDVQSPTTDQVMFMALRMKPEGTDDSHYINLPLLHIQDSRAQQLKKQIKLVWAATPPAATVIASSGFGWNRIFQYWPPASSTFISAGSNFEMLPWIANSSFATAPAVSGTSVVNANARVRTSESTVEIFLDPTIFPRGTKWVVQIKRSKVQNYNHVSYTSGNEGSGVPDPFGYYISSGSKKIQDPQDRRPSKTFIANLVSVYNTHPIARPGMALIAIKAKNQGVNSLSVLASGLVDDWNGTEWLGLVATSNPAPHLRALWTGEFNPDPLESDLVDETNMVAWRQWCIDYDRTCDMIADGRTVQELGNIIASCGRARVRMSDLWGVFYDRSREGVLDTPVQVFSPRTTNNFAFQKAFETRPEAFRVTFRDSENNYEEDELFVAAPDVNLVDATKFEAASIEGIVTTQKVRNRIFYDHLQLYYRDTIFSLDVDFAALVCRMGDLVGVNHDVMVYQHGHASIKGYTLVTGNVSAIELDAEVLVESATVDLFALADVFTATDFFAIDVKTGVTIALSNSTGSILTKEVSNAPGVTKTLTFSPTWAPPSGFESGLYVTVGRITREYDEFIVVSINPVEDLSASLILTPYNSYMYGDEIGVPWAPDGLYWSDGTGWSW